METQSPTAYGRAMITKQELIKKHKSLNIPLPTIEKDYILGLMLSCLYRHPIIKNQWFFKGGTCLKKLYINDYRFSEDLDFSLTNEASIDPQEIESYLLEAFALGEKLFGLIIDKANININPFPDKNGLFIQIRVPFQSPLMTSGSLPKIKLDLSKNEVLVDEPSIMPLFHFYSDEDNVSVPILSYSLDEIFSEKCRALVERTRPRDLYDVIHLYEIFYQSYSDWDKFLKIAHAKFEFKSLSFPKDFMNLSPSLFEATREAWSYMLSHQIYPLEAIDDYIQKYFHIVDRFSRL